MNKYYLDNGKAFLEIGKFAMNETEYYCIVDTNDISKIIFANIIEDKIKIVENSEEMIKCYDYFNVVIRRIED